MVSPFPRREKTRGARHMATANPAYRNPGMARNQQAPWVDVDSTNPASTATEDTPSAAVLGFREECDDILRRHKIRLDTSGHHRNIRLCPLKDGKRSSSHPTQPSRAGKVRSRPASAGSNVSRSYGSVFGREVFIDRLLTRESSFTTVKAAAVGVNADVAADVAADATTEQDMNDVPAVEASGGAKGRKAKKAVEEKPRREIYQGSRRRRDTAAYHLIAVGGRPKSAVPTDRRRPSTASRTRSTQYERTRPALRRPRSALAHQIAHCSAVRRPSSASAAFGHIGGDKRKVWNPSNLNSTASANSYRQEEGDVPSDVVEDPLDAYLSQCQERSVLHSTMALDCLVSAKPECLRMALTYQSIGPAHAAALCSAVVAFVARNGPSMISAECNESSSGVHIDLTGNILGARGAAEIGGLLLSAMPRSGSNTSLDENSTSVSEVIRSVDLAENSLRDQGAKIISKALSGGPKLHRLGLRGNKLTDSCAQDISYAVMDCQRSFRELDLSQNDFGPAVLGGALGSALIGNNRFERLDLGWNRLRCRGSMALLEGAAQARALQSLSLPFNSLSDGAGVLLGNILSLKACVWESRAHATAGISHPPLRSSRQESFPALRELDVSHNQMGPRTCAAITKALKMRPFPCNVLQRLELGFNGFGFSATCDAIKAVCEDMDGAGPPSLTRLGLENTFARLRSAADRDAVASAGLLRNGDIAQHVWEIATQASTSVSRWRQSQRPHGRQGETSISPESTKLVIATEFPYKFRAASD